MKDPFIRKSLKKRLLWQILTFVAVIMVVMTIIVTVMLRMALTRNLKSSLSVIAYHYLENIEQRVSFLSENIKNFSHNHFVINSLIDPQGRTLYLPRVVQDFSTNRDVSAVTIVGYAGNVIHSSLENPPPYWKTINLRAGLVMGETIIQLSENQKNIICVEPIEYYETPQGAVIVELSLASIMSKVLNPKNINFCNLYSGKSVLLSQKFGEGEAYITAKDKAKEDLPYLNRLAAGIEIGILKAQYLSPVSEAIVPLLLIGVFFIAAAIVIAARIGNGIARPILTLCEKVERAEMSVNEKCSPIGTADELEKLAQVFDNRTDQLITAMKRLEEYADELSETNNHLKQEITEHQLAEKRKEQLETQLRQVHKMKSIGTLAGGIAHNFNNLLAPIIGYAEMTMDEVPEDSVAGKNLAAILTASNRARELVRQLLTFSRQGKQELKPLQAQPVIKDALQLLRSSIPTTIEFRQSIDMKCGPIMGDADQLHQVIVNLCTNAYHAMRETGGILEVGLSAIDIEADELLDELSMQPGRYLRLTVSDTGRGMPSDVLECIFDPYYTTKEPGDGTGLGLTVAHGIIKTHGGDIRVYSKPGQGTTCNVYLPLLAEQLAAPESVLTETSLPGGHEHILLVDDEEALVQMKRQMLERLGYHVTAKTSSVEALETFRHQTQTFDLVITDMTMPEITGDCLAKEMMHIRPNIPVILCTGFSEMITEEKARNLGIKKFIMKPVSMKHLANSIRSTLDDNG